MMQITSFITYDLRLVQKVSQVQTEIWWNNQINKGSPVEHKVFSNLDECDLNVACKVARFDRLFARASTADGSSIAMEVFLYTAMTMNQNEKESSNNIYVFVVTYSAYLDLLLLIIVFSLVSFINTSLTSRAYYLIFSQINLFTHKLQDYTDHMLKPAELSPFSIDDLLFPERSEISDFFLEFFEIFHQNSMKSANAFDMTDSVERITSQLKKTRKFRKRFDETVGDYLRKLVGHRWPSRHGLKSRN